MKQFYTFQCVIYALLLVSCTPVTKAAPEEKTLLLQTQTLVPNGDFSAPLENSWEARGPAAPKVEIVDVDMPDFKRAAKLTLGVRPQNTWDARYAAPRTALAIARKDILGVRFWARSPQSLRIGVMYQLAETPHSKALSKTVTLSPQWEEYRLLANADPGFAANQSNFEFHMGYGVGAIEIANVRVENFGQTQLSEVEKQIGPQTIDYWGGQEHDDKWKIAAQQRIEKYRKGNLKIRVTDGKGRPISNAQIKIVQTRQQFRWGSAVVAGRLIDEQNMDNLRYRNEVKRLFNTIVFENDLKWDNKNPGKTEQALKALKWLKANNITVRGHTLVWGSRKYLPGNVTAAWEDTEKLRELVRTRVREQATAFKGQLYVWDAVNEAATNVELWDKLGWDEFANVYKIAREVDPNVKLAYNDYNISNESQDVRNMTAHREKVKERVRLLLAKKAPIDILGDQAHFGLPLTPPRRMIEIWDEMAQLGLPIEITEFDAGIPDDKVHGEYVRDFLIAAFSHPKIEAVLMWGFWEGSHWRAGEGGAMFRKDWSKRPAQLMYEDLVLKQWMTNTSGKSNKQGEYSTRGFYGDYIVTVRASGRTKTMPASLRKSGTDWQVVLK